MELPVPSAFHHERDTSPADWFVAALKPWDKDRVRVWSFVPGTFAAFARVLHPAHRVEGNRGTVRWSELAGRNGVTIGPSTGFPEVSGVDPSDQHAWDDAVPNEGNLEREQVEAIAQILAPYTRTPERCWVASWEGWGSWGPGSSTTLKARLGRPKPRKIGRRERRALHRAVEETRRERDAIPRVVTQHRAYFLFTARLEDVSSFAVDGWDQAPSIWWPDDRTWCVATEVDGYSTYVGGTKDCIGALLASDRVEAIPVTPDTPFDPGPSWPSERPP